MPDPQSFRNLVVWQKSMKLAGQVYDLTKLLPESEKFGLFVQLRRAAVSVPSNIAEGHGRNSKGEFRQFIGISRGSLREMETQVELCFQFGFIQESQAEGIFTSCHEIAKMLYGLEKTLTARS